MVRFDQNIITWLLQDDNLPVQYRTLTELLGIDPAEEIVQLAKSRLPEDKNVKRIFAQKHPAGYWLQKNPRTGQVLGHGVEYGSFATTHFCLAYLAELGLDRLHPEIESAADRYLNLQAEDGDFWLHLSCLLGYNIRTFIKLGFRDDPRLQKSIDLLLNTDREDGGYLCDLHDNKYKTRATKSCIRGATKALLACAELPEYWQHPRVKKLVDYFIARHGIFKSDRQTYINFDAARTSFPMTWAASLVDILLGLSQMGYGAAPELDRAWQLLDTKKNSAGQYILDFTSTQAPLKAGKRGEPNKWVTFYALLAHKHRQKNGWRETADVSYI